MKGDYNVLGVIHTTMESGSAAIKDYLLRVFSEQGVTIEQIDKVVTQETIIDVKDVTGAQTVKFFNYSNPANEHKYIYGVELLMADLPDTTELEDVEFESGIAGNGVLNQAKFEFKNNVNTGLHKAVGSDFNRNSSTECVGFNGLVMPMTWAGQSTLAYILEASKALTASAADRKLFLGVKLHTLSFTA